MDIERIIEELKGTGIIYHAEERIATVSYKLFVRQRSIYVASQTGSSYIPGQTSFDGKIEVLEGDPDLANFRSGPDELILELEDGRRCTVFSTRSHLGTGWHDVKGSGGIMPPST